MSPAAGRRRLAVRVGRDLGLPERLGADAAAVAATARAAAAATAVQATSTAAVASVRGGVCRLPRAAVLRAGLGPVLQGGGQALGAVQAARPPLVPIKPKLAVPFGLDPVVATSVAWSAASTASTASASASSAASASVTAPHTATAARTVDRVTCRAAGVSVRGG